MKAASKQIVSPHPVGGVFAKLFRNWQENTENSRAILLQHGFSESAIAQMSNDNCTEFILFRYVDEIGKATSLDIEKIVLDVAIREAGAETVDCIPKTYPDLLVKLGGLAQEPTSHNWLMAQMDSHKATLRGWLTGQIRMSLAKEVLAIKALVRFQAGDLQLVTTKQLRQSKSKNPRHPPGAIKLPKENATELPALELEEGGARKLIGTFLTIFGSLVSGLEQVLKTNQQQIVSGDAVQILRYTKKLFDTFNISAESIDDLFQNQTGDAKNANFSAVLAILGRQHTTQKTKKG